MNSVKSMISLDSYFSEQTLFKPKIEEDDIFAQDHSDSGDKLFKNMSSFNKKFLKDVEEMSSINNSWSNS